MNGAGLFLAVAGVWVLSQTLAGGAMQRLGLLPSAGPPPTGKGGAGLFGVIPKIPYVPQGPVTGIPFSPIAAIPAHPVVTPV